MLRLDARRGFGCFREHFLAAPFSRGSSTQHLPQHVVGVLTDLGTRMLVQQQRHGALGSHARPLLEANDLALPRDHTGWAVRLIVVRRRVASSIEYRLLNNDRKSRSSC